MRRAVIDIGTNTVKLLVADVRAGQVWPVNSKDRTTRLGEGLAETGHLSLPAIERTVQTIREYLAAAREHGVAEVRVIATAAAREAENRQVFLDAVRRQCGLEVELVSGQREAELIFRGVTSEPRWAKCGLLVMDIGGGSVEFIQGAAGGIERWQSLPLGAVRLTEQFAGFAELAEFLRGTFRTALAGYDLAGRQFVATGGTNLTLVRIAKGKVEDAVLTQAEVLALVARLHALPLAERRCVPGLPPDRADIIVAGAAVLAFAMEALGAYELSVSTRSLRYGALLD